MDTTPEVTQRVLEFYARLCPGSKISVHVASIMHDRDEREAIQFVVRVVVEDPEDSGKVICVLAKREGRSPQDALLGLLGDRVITSAPRPSRPGSAGAGGSRS